MGKKITFMVIPHDGKKVMTARVSHQSLTVILVLCIVLISVIVLFLFQMGSLYVKALRVDALERRNRELEADQAKLTLLERRLVEMEETATHLKTLLGVDKTPPPLDLTELAELRSQGGARSSELESPADNYLFTEDMASYLEEQRREGRSTPSGLPLEGWISRTFSEEHPAVDIVAPLLTPIMATADGVCTFSGWDDRWGNYVEIRHNESIKTFYAHNSKNRVERGDEIRKGDIIAFLGSTGRSTGPHLHYAVIVDGEKVDPLSFSFE